MVLLSKQSNLARVQSTIIIILTRNTVKDSESSVKTQEQATLSSFTASPHTGWHQTGDWPSGGHLTQKGPMIVSLLVLVARQPFPEINSVSVDQLQQLHSQEKDRKDSHLGPKDRPCEAQLY